MTARIFTFSVQAAGSGVSPNPGETLLIGNNTLHSTVDSAAGFITSDTANVSYEWSQATLGAYGGGAFVPGLGSVRGLKEVAFQTHEDGEVLPRSFSHQNDAFVFVRKSFEQADREEFNNQKDEVTESVRQSKEQAAVAEFIRSLKESTNIAYNNEFLSRYIQN